MKHSTLPYFGVLLSVMLIFSSCYSDFDEVFPVDNESYTTNVFGIVTDQAGNPIEGASVSYRDNSVVTDQYGTYLFRDVEVDSRYNHINVNGEGYFDHTRTFRGAQSKTILLKSILAPSNFDHTIPSDQPATVSIGSIDIQFDGKGMITTNDNQSYTGEVEVAVFYLDPTQETTADMMPGDLSAINSNDNLRLLESFGMVGVELRTNDGRELQLASESKATITAKIPSSILSEAPEQIPLWHFDHEIGLWVEEGSAVKEGENYIGEVSHFSFWNFDLPRDPVLLRGRLVDKNGVGLASMQLKVVRENEGRGASGYTDYDGYFSGPIERGTALELSVVSKCDGEEIVYNTLIGPFDQDADIGEIELDVADIEYLNVVGTFNTCDDEVMEDGLLKIDDQGRPDYFPIIGGSIDQTLGICGANTIALEVIDRQSQRKTNLGEFNVPGNVDLGIVKVCDSPVNFASISSPTFDIDLVMVDSVSFTPIGTSKSILAFDFAYEVAVLEIKYVDQDDQNIEVGTHDILKMVCNWRPDSSAEEIVLLLDEGEITIEEVDSDERSVKGNFVFEAIVAGINEKHVFEGSFFSYF